MNSYIGEIILATYNRTPQGFVPCDGSLLSIANYPYLYQLIGTTYGGDGKTNFAVPDLRGRVPLGAGNTTRLGQLLSAGTPSVTPVQYLPIDAATVAPANVASVLVVDAPASDLNPPYLSTSYFICGEGLYPS